MKSFLCALFLFCGLVVPSHSLDRNAFSFTRYDLELRIDAEAQALAARGKIVLRNTSRQTQTVAALQISSSLEWRLLQAGGKPLGYLSQPYTSDIDHTGSVTEAIVTLPAAISPGGKVELEVGYSGTVAFDTTRLTRIGTPADAAAHTDWDQISQNFTALRGIGHVVWYPVALEAANLSEGDLFPALAAWRGRENGSELNARLCWAGEADQALTVASNGVLVGVGRQEIQSEEGGQASLGCSTYRFSGSELAAPSFAIGEFVVLERPGITVYHLAEHKTAAQDYALAAEKVAPFIADWLGAPRQKVRVVDLNHADAAPYDSGLTLFTPLATNSQQIETSIAHQLAHAAFTSSRLWMSEGLAHFAQALEREQQQGRKAAVAMMAGGEPALVAVEKAALVAPDASGSAHSLIASDDDIYYRTKAMYVWWMLRDLVGERALQGALKAYRPGQDKTPSYFQQLLQAQSKRDLEWFFDDWVYRDRSLPDFRVDAAYPRQMLPSEYVVTVTVENLGNAGAQVPVLARTAQGNATQPLLVPAREKAVIRIRVPALPTEVIVNDGSVPESDMANNTFKVAAKPQ